MLKKILISTTILAFPSAATVAYAARLSASPEKEPHLVTLSEIVVPVIDGERISGKLVFDVVIDTADEEAASRMAVAVPRLRSAAIGAGIEFSRLHVSGLTPVDVEGLSNEVQLALKREDADVGRVLIVKAGATVA